MAVNSQSEKFCVAVNVINKHAKQPFMFVNRIQVNICSKQSSIENCWNAFIKQIHVNSSQKFKYAGRFNIKT